MRPRMCEQEPVEPVRRRSQIRRERKALPDQLSSHLNLGRRRFHPASIGNIEWRRAGTSFRSTLLPERYALTPWELDHVAALENGCDFEAESGRGRRQR